MAKLNLPSQEYLNNILEYDKETGKIYWKHRPDYPKKWNTRFAGKEAFTARMGEGNKYLYGAINYKNYYAHRVIWKIINNEDPIQIDHINGIKYDNRIENLRSVTISQNQRNRPISKNNTSGYNGVNWHPTAKKWTVRTSDGYFGLFINIEDAIAKRKEIEKKYGFGENCGRPYV